MTAASGWPLLRLLASRLVQSKRAERTRDFIDGTGDFGHNKFDLHLLAGHQRRSRNRAIRRDLSGRQSLIARRPAYEKREDRRSQT